MPEVPKLPTALPPDDRRLTLPLFTSREAARYVRVTESTMRNWVRGYTYPSTAGRNRAMPIVSSVGEDRPSRATIPFIGLAEALVVAGFRQKDLSMQKIRAALRAVDAEVGIPHALATKTLYVSGASILWDYARREGDAEVAALVEPAEGQTVFVPAVRDYLRLISYDANWWASQIELPAFHPSRVVVDMKRGFGRPILDESRLSVDVIVDRFYRGYDSISEIARDLELDEGEVENVIRAAWPSSSAA